MNEEVFQGLLQITYQEEDKATSNVITAQSMEYVVVSEDPKKIRIKTQGIIFNYEYKHTFIIKDLSSGKESDYEITVQNQIIEIKIDHHFYEYKDSPAPQVIIQAKGVTNLYAKNVARGIRKELEASGDNYIYIPENYAEKIEIYFSTDGGILNYLSGKTFKVNNVWFAEKYFGFKG